MSSFGYTRKVTQFRDPFFELFRLANNPAREPPVFPPFPPLPSKSFSEERAPALPAFLERRCPLVPGLVVGEAPFFFFPLGGTCRWLLFSSGSGKCVMPVRRLDFFDTIRVTPFFPMAPSLEPQMTDIFYPSQEIRRTSGFPMASKTTPMSRTHGWRPARCKRLQPTEITAVLVL